MATYYTEMINQALTCLILHQIISRIEDEYFSYTDDLRIIMGNDMQETICVGFLIC